MTIFERNLKAIEKNDPMFYHAIMDTELESESIQFYIEQAQNGTDILFSEKNGRFRSMNSLYDPEFEADRFVAQYDKAPDYAFMIFFGFNNGMIAERLMRKKESHIRYLFYEPSPALFMQVLKRFDLTGLLECERVQIVVSGLNDDRLDVNIASGITIENYRICYYDSLPAYRQLYEEEEKKVEHQYRYSVNVVASNLETVGYFGEAETYNNIYNMRKLRYCNCQEDFEGVFPLDRPAIIVAAGPSLEKNVDELKKAKGKMLIIAVDTALRYLISKGVYPDLAVVVDPKKPEVLFENEEVQRIPLATYTAANYKILELVKGKVIYVSSESMYYNRIFELGGKHMYDLSGGGSVATYAFVLAISWGYRKIVLVGQDLALGQDKVHAGDDDIDTHKLVEGKIEIEGYYGEPVYSSPDYDFYREWYEVVIRGDDSLEVVNATEGGARIKGTKPMPLREVIEQFDVEPFDFGKAIAEMPPTFSLDQYQQIVAMWKDSIEHLKLLKQKMYNGMRQIESGIKLIQGKRYTQKEVGRAQRGINRILEECNSFDEIYFVDRIVAKDEGDVLGDIYNAKEDDAEEVCRIFEKLLKYVKAMYSATDEVREMFEKIIRDVETQ